MHLPDVLFRAATSAIRILPQGCSLLHADLDRRIPAEFSQATEAMLAYDTNCRIPQPMWH
jgi:hypothetical protein